jgi:CheY-like chemotaxis protein
VNVTDGSASQLVAIVDDEEDITTFLRVALEDHGYRVLAVNDARDALDRLAVAQPDVVLLDLLMPQVTGVSLYARIVGHPRLKQVPVVILSGLARREEHVAFFRQDGVPLPAAFVDKPVDVDEVLATIRRVTTAAEVSR